MKELIGDYDQLNLEKGLQVVHGFLFQGHLEMCSLSPVGFHPSWIPFHMWGSLIFFSL